MPEYRIPLDPRNPGHFFACCGLFELAELAVPGATAGFENGGSAFVLLTDAPIPPRKLTLGPGSSLDGKPYDDKLEPLDLTIGEHVLTLNWWLNKTLTHKSELKSWGGNQKPRDIDKLIALLDFDTSPESLFEFSRYTTSRFGVDARSAWDAIDLGYSPNDAQRKTDKQARTFGWVEVLAVVGLQGFRPVKVRRGRYRYALWAAPLPLAVARAAAAAPWPGLPAHSFEFQIAIRGQGYKTFLFAEGVTDV